MSRAETVGATAGTVVEAVAFGDVVALTVPWGAVPAAIEAAGALDGKIVWDCTNALLPDMSGLQIGTSTSGGEEVARLCPGARMVKGIPPFAQLLHSDDPTVAGQPVGTFVAGDDDAAKAMVADLLTDLPTRVTDAGPLSAARFIEPAMMLLVQLAYLQGFGPRIGLTLTRDDAPPTA